METTKKVPYTLGELRKQIQERNGKQSVKELAREISLQFNDQQIELLMSELAWNYHKKQESKNEEHF